MAQGLAWLTTQIGDQATELVLRLADGAPLRAVELAQEGIVARRREWLEQIVALRRGQQSPIAVAAEWMEDAQSRPLYWFAIYLMDLIRLNQGGSESVKNIDLIDALNIMADGFSSYDLHSLLERTVQTQQLAQQSGMNRQLLLEELLTEWSRAGRVRRARA